MKFQYLFEIHRNGSKCDSENRIQKIKHSDSYIKILLSGYLDHFYFSARANYYSWSLQNNTINCIGCSGGGRQVCMHKLDDHSNSKPAYTIL